MTAFDWMQSYLFMAEIMAMNAAGPIEDEPLVNPGLRYAYERALANAIGWASRG